MDELFTKLNQLASGLILEKARFGRAGILSLWVETKSLRAFAEKIAAEKSLKLDWLEDFQVAKMDNALVISYWLRSYEDTTQLVFRCSVELAKKDAEIEIPSLRDLWPMIAPFENDSGELFGIRYTLAGSPVEVKRNLLPESVQDFPLRHQREARK